MDTLDRFLLKEFTIYFLLVVCALVVLFLGIDFLSKFWGMTLPLPKVVALYAYRIPKTIQLFAPVACLMSTLLVLTAMSRQNEILALYSSGIGTLRIVSTFVAIAATLSTFGFLTFDSIVPVFTKKEILLQKGLDPSQEHLLNFNRTGFWYRSGTLIYNVGRYIPQANLLEDVRVYLMSPTFHLQKMMRAKEARFVDNDWVLENGFEVKYDSTSGFPEYKPFKFSKGIIPEKPGDFKTFQIEEDTMRLRDLRKYIEKNKAYGFDTTAQQVTYHERLALVFTPLIFVLLGIPFATRPLKTHSMAKSIGFCFLIVFIYLISSKLAVSIGKGGHVPPIIAAWTTNVVFLLGSGLLILRKGHA